MQRVTVYIDGFNLYYGLRDKNWKRYLWLDVRRLSENLLLSGQRLVAVRYFTARVHHDPRDPDKRLRQDTFLDATATLPDVRIHEGYFKPKMVTCAKCKMKWQTYEEKMTDVNIAVELLGDAQDDVFDTAIIISGDGDLATPVRAVRKRYSKKRTVIAFPPGRHAAGLVPAASAYFTIGRDVLRDSQLPNRIPKPDGYVLTRPPTWN